VRVGGCGLPELDLKGEERVEEVGADEAGDEVSQLAAILLHQKAALVLGRVAWSGQPCQKQPSTKPASRRAEECN
jgi:hypothetical protein